jgi:hypothetical protein
MQPTRTVSMEFRDHVRYLKRRALAMVSNSAQYFQFMDLPGRLRNQVYAFFLSSFGPLLGGPSPTFVYSLFLLVTAHIHL